MSRLISLIFIGLLFLSFASKETNSINCNLTLKFSNIRNTDGKLFVFLYNYENQYPDNPFKYFEIEKKTVRNKCLNYNIPNLRSGKYAISIIDDENSNDDLDFFFGLPTEGYAFSNNIRPFLSLPDYDELLFKVYRSRQQISIQLNYWF